MIGKLIVLGIVPTVVFGGVAQAQSPTADLTATLVEIIRRLGGDDVGGSPKDSVLEISVRVRNRGGLAVTPASPNSVSFAIDGTTYETLLTGTGGGSDDPIPPAGEGAMSVQVPLRTLRHCQPVALRIDTRRQVQRGPGVFANDASRQTVIDKGNGRVCPPASPQNHGVRPTTR